MRSINRAAIAMARLLADALRCKTCGLLMTVSNASLLAGKRGTTLERVTPETHCACPASGDRPAGPAWVPENAADNTLERLCERAEAWGEP